MVAKEKRGEKRSGVCYARAIYARRDAARHRAAMCARVMRMHHDAARGRGCGEHEKNRKRVRKGESTNDSLRSPRDENFMVTEKVPSVPRRERERGVTREKTHNF